MRDEQVIALVGRVLLGALMIYAGVLKVIAPSAFADDIANYHVLPQLAPLLAVTLPMIEIVAGLALIALRGAWRAAGALLIVALLVTFTLAVASARVRGIDLHCGCFGGNGDPVTNVTVLRDVALVAWAAFVTASVRPPRPAR